MTCATSARSVEPDAPSEASARRASRCWRALRDVCDHGPVIGAGFFSAGAAIVGDPTGVSAAHSDFADAVDESVADEDVVDQFGRP